MAAIREESLQGLDEQTVDSIIHLQLQDANSYASSSKGKAVKPRVMAIPVLIYFPTFGHS